MRKEKDKEKEHLALKWGTLKRWNFEGNEKCIKLLQEYSKIGSSMSAMLQHDTPEQKKLICQMIDEVNVKKIYLDWDGKLVSKKAAKKYVMEYNN